MAHTGSLWLDNVRVCSSCGGSCETTLHGGFVGGSIDEDPARTSQGRRPANPAWVGARGGLGWWGAGWGGGGRGGGDVGVVVAGAVGGAGESWGERAVGAAPV